MRPKSRPVLAGTVRNGLMVSSLCWGCSCLACLARIYCKHSSQPENKERDREFKEFDNTTENLTRTSRVQKMRPRTITRGLNSYLSAHRDPKNKKEFDNATETLTRAALRPE